MASDRIARRHCWLFGGVGGGGGGGFGLGMWGRGDLLLVECEAIGDATNIGSRLGGVHSEEFGVFGRVRRGKEGERVYEYISIWCASEDTDGCGECHAAIYWPRPTCAATSRLLFASC